MASPVLLLNLPRYTGLKAKGNTLVQNRDDRQAIKVYSQALEMLLEVLEELRMLGPHRMRLEGVTSVFQEAAKVHSNLSMLHLRLGDEDSALREGDSAVTFNLGWWKGHARRGEALAKMGRHQVRTKPPFLIFLL